MGQNYLKGLLRKSKIEILLPLGRHQNDKFFALFPAFSDVMLSGVKHLHLDNTPLICVPLQVKMSVIDRLAKKGKLRT